MESVEKFVDDKLGRMGRAQVRDGVKRLAPLIAPGEEVVSAAACKLDGTVGLMAVTNQRVLFLGQGVFKKSHEEYPYASITGMKSEKGRGNGSITVVMGARSVEFDNINPGERYEEIVPYLRQQLNQTPPPPATAPNVADQLTQLASLKDAGILTQDEFDTKKAELLARM